MKKKTSPAKSKSSNKSHFFFILGAFALGSIGTFAITKVFAQSTNEKIYSCVNNTNGNVRVIKSGENCKNNESSLSWVKDIPTPQTPPPGSGSSGGLSSPFFCTNCYLTGLADKFAGKDFSRSQITRGEFSGADLTGVIFKDSYLTNSRFLNANLTNADFSSIREIAGWGTPQNNNYTGANLTNTNMSSSLHHESNFTNANLQGANFSNSILRGAKFTEAQNMETANVTGATWENVTCPDGTNSDSNGNTCVGHM